MGLDGRSRTFSLPQSNGSMISKAVGNMEMYEIEGVVGWHFSVARTETVLLCSRNL